MAPATEPGTGLELPLPLATLGPGSLMSWLCGSPWPAHVAPLGHTGAKGNQVESLVGSGWTTVTVPSLPGNNEKHFPGTYKHLLVFLYIFCLVSIRSL